MKKAVSVIACFVCCGITPAQTFTLEQLKDSALSHNIAVSQARYGIDAAREQRREAFTKFFPTVSGTAAWFNANRGMARMDIDPQEYITPELGATLAQSLPAEALAALGSPMSMSMMKNGTIASLTAVQPVFAGGQIATGNRLARVGEEVSRLQLQVAENDVERQVEQYYWQLVTMQQKLSTVDTADSLLARIYKDVEVAVRAGVALRNDLLQVELRRNDLESQRLKLGNGIGLVGMLLAQYCGMNGTEVRVSCPEPDAEQYDVPAAMADAPLDGLPEYRLLEMQAEAARLQRKMEIGKNLPTVGVGAGFNYHNLLDNDRTFAMLFATVSVPISAWWGGSHAVRRKTIEHRQAVDRLEDSAQLLRIRVQKAWNDVEEARRQTDIASRGVVQAEENLRLHRDFYNAGTCTMGDLLQAQLLCQQALDRRTDAWADLQLKLLEYRLSVGQS